MIYQRQRRFSVLEKYAVPVERKSADNTTNTYGRHLLEPCKNNNLFILNGRIGQDRSLPRATCKDQSTVDYFLSTVENFSVFENFTNHEYSELYSDAHCPLSFCLNVDLLAITRQNYANKIDVQEPKVKKRGATLRDNFIENFDVMEAATNVTKLNELLHNTDITKSNIN